MSDLVQNNEFSKIVEMMESRRNNAYQKVNEELILAIKVLQSLS